MYALRHLNPKGLLTGNELWKAIIADCNTFQDICVQLGVKPAVKLPDVAYETDFPPLFTEFPEIQFFGFTRDIRRMARYCRGKFPYNYHLTFSSNNELDCKKVLHNVGNVALKFKEVPNSHWGYQVHKASNPFRFLDNFGVIALSKGE